MTTGLGSMTMAERMYFLHLGRKPSSKTYRLKILSIYNVFVDKIGSKGTNSGTKKNVQARLWEKNSRQSENLVKIAQGSFRNSLIC